MILVYGYDRLLQLFENTYELLLEEIPRFQTRELLLAIDKELFVNKV